MFLKSLPSILLAIFSKEKGAHPWIIIIDIFVISSDAFKKKSKWYLKKYFKANFTLHDGYVVDFFDFKIIVPKTFIDDYNFSYGLLILYFDIIYPHLVSNPIPVLLNEGPYQNEGVILRADDIVIDAGANIGFFSLFARTRIGLAGKIYAFEPIQELAAQIDRNANLNNFNNIFPINSALGDSLNDITFNYTEERVGGSMQSANGNEIIVKQTTIDMFVVEKNLSTVNFIKMDIEGMEPNALIGASETIRKFKPRLAICTYHDTQHPEQLEKIIKNLRPDYQIAHSSHKLYAW